MLTNFGFNQYGILIERRLITSDLTDVFTKPTYAAAQGLLNNYARNYSVQEEFTPEQLAEEVAFIDLVMETSVMQLLREFLFSKGAPSLVLHTFQF